jgi:hypothetical protein
MLLSTNEVAVQAAGEVAGRQLSESNERVRDDPPNQKN